MKAQLAHLRCAGEGRRGATYVFRLFAQGRVAFQRHKVEAPPSPSPSAEGACSLVHALCIHLSYCCARSGGGANDMVEQIHINDNSASNALCLKAISLYANQMPNGIVYILYTFTN